MGVMSSAAVRLLCRRARRGAVALMVASCLALSACTAGEGAAEGGGSDGASGDVTAADSQAGSGKAVDPATGTMSGEAAAVAPVLPPPGTPPAAAHGAEAEAALAAMPGLYGLTRLRTEVFDDRIAFQADADCGTVMDILQSGQWALELGDGGGPAVTDGSDPAAGGAEGAVTRIATLRLGGDVAQVQLTETGGGCSGAIARPAAG